MSLESMASSVDSAEWHYIGSELVNAATQTAVPADLATVSAATVTAGTQTALESMPAAIGAAVAQTSWMGGAGLAVAVGVGITSGAWLVSRSRRGARQSPSASPTANPASTPAETPAIWRPAPLPPSLAQTLSRTHIGPFKFHFVEQLSPLDFSVGAPFNARCDPSAPAMQPQLPPPDLPTSSYRQVETMLAAVPTWAVNASLVAGIGAATLIASLGALRICRRASSSRFWQSAFGTPSQALPRQVPARSLATKKRECVTTPAEREWMLAEFDAVTNLSSSSSSMSAISQKKMGCSLAAQGVSSTLTTARDPLLQMSLAWDSQSTTTTTAPRTKTSTTTTTTSASSMSSPRLALDMLPTCTTEPWEERQASQGTAATRIDVPAEQVPTVDIGFNVLASARQHFKPGAADRTGAYVLGGVVRPRPTSHSRIFRILPEGQAK